MDVPWRCGHGLSARSAVRTAPRIIPKLNLQAKSKLIRECKGSLKAGKNCGTGYTSYKSKKYFEFEGGD